MTQKAEEFNAILAKLSNYEIYGQRNKPIYFTKPNLTESLWTATKRRRLENDPLMLGGNYRSL